MLFNRYNNKVLNFCLRILGNRADAEEIAADVFLALFSKKYVLDPNAKFSTWLFTVARNKCISHLRKHKGLVGMWVSDGKRDYTAWEPADETDSSRDTLEKKEAAKRVHRAMAQLPLEQREAIVLREFHQFSYNEIASILHCSLEKVKILIYRGREQLRNDLASYFEEAQS